MPRRLTALNTSALLVFAFVVTAIVSFSYSLARERQLDDALRRAADDVSASQVTWDAARRQAVLASLDQAVFSTPVLYLQAASSDGVILARSATLREVVLPIDGARVARALNGEAWFEDDVVLGQQSVRIYETPLWARSIADTRILAGILQVARPAEPLAGLARQALLIGVVVCVALALPLALLTAALLTRWAMAPLDRVATSLRAISDAGDLTLRIDPGAPRTHPAVARLTLELNRMLGRLEVAARRIDEVLTAQRRFVADASHELRTPLTTLRGNIHLLREDEPSGAESEHQAILADMAADTERMTRLVNDLLLLAEADAGLHLALETLDLVPLIRHAARSVRWVREDVELRMNFASEEPAWVLGDADRLTQVLLVLLDNALKFSPSGGVVDVRLSAAPRQGAPGARVEVADDGPGVAPNERAQIFERFYRSDRARQGEGAGLGLAIARWIVDEHHGTLDVESISNRGATFGLWLPTTSAPHEG